MSKQTKDAVRGLWLKHWGWFSLIPKPVWDELDAVIRADERSLLVDETPTPSQVPVTPKLGVGTGEGVREAREHGSTCPECGTGFYEVSSLRAENARLGQTLNGERVVMSDLICQVDSLCADRADLSAELEKRCALIAAVRLEATTANIDRDATIVLREYERGREEGRAEPPAIPSEDTRRLDWLEANGRAMSSAIEMDRGVYLDGPTIRAAIDAEMKP